MGLTESDVVASPVRRGGIWDADVDRAAEGGRRTVEGAEPPDADDGAERAVRIGRLVGGVAATAHTGPRRPPSRADHARLPRRRSLDPSPSLPHPFLGVLGA